MEVNESSMEHVSSWKDYPTWKCRIISLLLGLRLKDIIDGTADTTVKGHLSKRDYVYSMLVMSMTDATIKFARDANPGDDAKALLDKISCS